MEDQINLGVVKSDDDKHMAFEQYKLIFDSINQANMVRETSNQFWITVNALGISAVAYIRDSSSLSSGHKTIVLGTLIILGMMLCGSWLSYLVTLKKNVEIRYDMLMELEKFFPVKAFQKALQRTERMEGRKSLTFREMLVPGLFIIGYLSFAVLLIFFPVEMVKNAG